MPSKALFSVSGFKSAFDFASLPSGISGVRLYSFGIEISLDFGFREQMLRDCQEHNKVSEVKTLSWIGKEKYKVYWSQASLHVLLGLMQTDRREELRRMNLKT